MSQELEEPTESRTAPMPSEIPFLAGLIAFIATVTLVSYPSRYFVGCAAIAALWVLYVATMRRVGQELQDQTPLLGMWLWCAVALVPTLLLVTGPNLSGLIDSNETATLLFKGLPLLCFFTLAIFVLPVVLPLLLTLLVAGTGAALTYKAGTLAVRGVLEVKLKQELHDKGYHWVTLLDAEYIVRKTGRAAFRLPHCDHIGTLPGYREGSAESLLPIIELLRK